MGSRASVDKNPDSVIRGRRSLASRAKGSFVASPLKDKLLNGEKAAAVFAVQSPEFGSKEDVFFDSRARWDSDCEDDFFSVNGDFTPSRGSTPSHHITTPFTPRTGNQTFDEKFPGSKSELSPTGRKKLADLFLESSDAGQANDAQNAVEQTVEFSVEPRAYRNSSVQPVKSVNGTPYLSGVSAATSTEATPCRNLKMRKERTFKAGNCCLPGLHTFSFDEKRQKILFHNYYMSIGIQGMFTSSVHAFH